jgi:hypothetical protein
MDEAANRTEIVFKTRNRQSCGEPQLVLASAGISSNLMQADGWWVIVVAPSDGAVALDELKLHQQDSSPCSHFQRRDRWRWHLRRSYLHDHVL